MSDERIDPETLAAFLDGTASPQEREGVLRTLARSPAAYADFLEASAIHRELSGHAPTHGHVEPAGAPAGGAAKRGWPRRGWYFAPALLAAALVAVIVMRRTGISPAIPESIQLVQSTSLTRERGPGSVGRALGEDWDRPPWSAVRGAEPTSATDALAFRSGARYAELELAAQAADSAGVVRAAEALERLLSTIEAGGPVGASFRDFAGSPDFGGPSRRAATARQTRALLGADDWFDLGVWAETARLTLAARDVSFFATGSRGSRAVRRIVQPHLEAQPAADGEWAPVVDAVRPLLVDRSWSPNDIPELERIVRAAISAAAR